MNKFYIVTASMLAFGLTAPAFAETVSSESSSKTKMEQDSDGSYSKKATKSSESTDSAGTTNKSETNVKESVDADGNGKKTVTTETSSDPKGLMNKTKTSTTDTVKVKDGNVEHHHKKKVDGKTVEDNSTEATH